MADTKKGSTGQPRLSPVVYQFWAARGQAIYAYSNVEHIFCEVFSLLTKMEIGTASYIFFEMNNSRVVGRILMNLMEKRYKNVYTAFFRSLCGRAGELSGVRNDIVHRSEATFIKDGKRGVILIKPDHWNYMNDANRNNLGLKDIDSFIDKCGFIWLLCSEFVFFLQTDSHPHPQWPEDRRKTWQKIFQRKVTYPPRSNHPLYQRWKALRSQHSPFRALSVWDVGPLEHWIS